MIAILVTVVGLGLSIVALVVTAQRAIRQEIGVMARDIADLRERVARLEGLLPRS